MEIISLSITEKEPDLFTLIMSCRAPAGVKSAPTQLPAWRFKDFSAGLTLAQLVEDELSKASDPCVVYVIAEVSNEQFVTELKDLNNPSDIPIILMRPDELTPRKFLTFQRPT